MTTKRVAIIGGRLQGVEAAYLAKKAGWQTLLVDREVKAPAAGLCTETLQLDICNSKAAEQALNEVELVFPCLENTQALESLEQLAGNLNCPICFDFAANRLSRSKNDSYALFAELGLPFPQPFPECGFPLLVKPNSASGSKGVRIFRSEAEYQRFCAESPETQRVEQQYLNGPSFSLEVIGRDGSYITPQITGLFMDAEYDCRRVTAPEALEGGLAAEFHRMSVEIARAINLGGIMDVEVVVHNHQLFLLEIDARLPSQTPITVFRSCGENMLQSLAALFTGGQPPPQREEKATVWLEHIRVEGEVMTLAGEHLVEEAGPLHLQENFFGISEALTDHGFGADQWCATLIHEAADEAALKAGRQTALDAICREHGIRRIIDSLPEQNQ